MNTNDVELTKLMEAVDKGTAQLPDFQRGWVWDDGRIKALIMALRAYLWVKSVAEMPVKPLHC